MTDHICVDYLHDPATPWWGITFLVVSNFVFAWTSLKAYYHRFYIQSILNLAALVMSSFYHACKPLNGWCIVPYFMLWTYDMFFALINVPVVVHYFLPYHAPILYLDIRKESEEEAQSSPQEIVLVSHLPTSNKFIRPFTGFLGKEVIQFVIYGIIIGFLIGIGWLNIYGYFILMGFTALEVVIVILFVRIRFGIWPFFHLGYLITGISLLALGALAFIMQDWVSTSYYVYVYSIVHSLWHMVSAIGQVFLIEARIYRPKSDILDHLKEHDIDLDHLTEDDVGAVTLAMYGDQKAVRDSIRFRRHQKASPWTVESHV